MLVCAKNSSLGARTIAFYKNEGRCKPDPGYIAIVVSITRISPNCKIAIAIISDSQPVKDRAVFVNASRSTNLKTIRAK
jgi:hypothetical protein